ncbi:uncharacterized protein NEMAJ01_0234 [Nematocida major]|uniref:uncharacterized protein n=1 Tax=Nematocida major TaxID=1912982 RepID=UPI002008661F|nr:uncharacterized protein NEMAJ01_0234 [Nematocida major]KAH9385338.1 hypothetical protein NEMAJ01_0234 [Nematocida major]
MKREREEDSEDEVFERRRKVHKQEKDVKDEIEDLFEENSTEHSVEEKSEEINSWGITGGVAAGVLSKIFGDGTDYLQTLEYYSRQNVPEEAAQEDPKDAGEDAKGVDQEDLVERVSEFLQETVSSIPRKSIEKIVAGFAGGRSLDEVVMESFYCLNSPQSHLAVLQARGLVCSYKERKKIVSHLPSTADENIKAVAACAHTLNTLEECTRLLQYVYGLQSKTCTDEDRKVAVKATHRMVYGAGESPDAAGTEGSSGKLNGLLYNPWIFRMAIEIGMEISEIEIVGGASVKLLARMVSGADMYLLQNLRARGGSYRLIINKEETVKRIVEKLRGVCSEGALKEAVFQFVEKLAEDICQGVEKELALFSEEHVKMELLGKALSILDMLPGKEPVLGLWADRGKFRYAKVDSREAVLASGVVQGRDALNLDEHRGIVAVSGKGYKLKQLARTENKAYIAEGVLRAMGEPKDFPVLLCKAVRNPLSAIEGLMGCEKEMPAIVPMQRMLKKNAAVEVLEYAAAYKKAEASVCASPEYAQMKKEVYEFVKSGGDPEIVLVDSCASCEEVRRAVKETVVPHTGWNRPINEPVIENKVYRKAYTQCVGRLEGISEVSSGKGLGKDEEFMLYNGISEEEFLCMQTSWSLSSGAKISMPGKVLGGTIVKAGQETQIRLSNGVFAVLGEVAREGLVNGQELQVRVCGLDMLNYRAVVKEEKKGGENLLRAASHWRVKSVSAKMACRLLKDKKFGSYVLRVSSSHPDSLILTIRITENPDKFFCVHTRIKEIRNGYELEGRVFSDIESITETYIPNYLKTVRRIMEHRKFTTEPVEAIKQRLAQGKKKELSERCALSVCKTTPGCALFVCMMPGEEAQEVLLPITERGLYFDRKVYAKPEDFISAFEKRRLQE